jgi:serine/threonine protein kinase
LSTNGRLKDDFANCDYDNDDVGRPVLVVGTQPLRKRKRAWRDYVSHFSPPKKIGSGGFSTVHRSFHASTGTPVVLKILTKSNNPRKGGFVAREQWCLENLDHPNIIRTPAFLAQETGLQAGIYETEEGSVVMIQEDANGGDPLDHVQQPGCLGEAQARDLATQLLSAMSYLHKNGVAHLDIKLENMVLHKVHHSSDLDR